MGLKDKVLHLVVCLPIEALTVATGLTIWGIAHLASLGGKNENIPSDAHGRAHPRRRARG